MKSSDARPALVLVILVLDIVVYLCIKKFLKINQWSGMILLSYFVWLLFAIYFEFCCRCFKLVNETVPQTSTHILPKITNKMLK